MNDNVESFDEYDTDLQIAAHQAGLVKVVLEGTTDVDLFKRFWFSDMLDAFEFVDAKALVGGTGCKAVREAVEKSQTTLLVPTAGIVDRDSLFAESRWELLYTIDDERFDREARTDDVFVTSFWEIEAYMLDPDLLNKWVIAHHVPPPGSAAKADRALSVCLAECDVLLNAASCFAALHSSGEAANAALYLGQNATRVAAACAQKIATLSAESQAVAQRTSELIGEVLRERPADDRARFLFSLRYVDTKRLIKRLIGALNVGNDTHWVLPLIQLESRRKPPELEKFLQELKGRYLA
jgi:hypothetical protein